MAHGNLTDLSRRPGMPSVTWLRKLILTHRDFPIIERGGRGRSYVIDLEAAETFIRNLKAPPVMDPARRLQAIREMGLTALAELGEKRRHAAG